MTKTKTVAKTNAILVKKMIVDLRNEHQTSSRAHTLKSVSDVTRLAVIEMLLNEKEVSVSEMIKFMNIEPTLLSHHLSILRDEGIVKSVRIGKSAIYSFVKKVKVTNGIKLNGIKITLY